MNYNAAIVEAAGRHLGTKEFPGAKHNPIILGFYAASGHDWVKDDETPWCAAFVGTICAELGIPNSGKLNARSYLDWGVPVAMKDATAGDIVVFWRGSPDAATGHVAIILRFEGDRVLVRGGNQGDAVTDAWYPVNRIVGIRRYAAAVPAKSEDNRPTLQLGAKGLMVQDLQDQLERAGYFHGKLDGIFGSLTRGAVLAFQADHDLKTDGVVGPATWDALQKAKPRPQRDTSLKELRAEGSRIVKEADKTQIQAASLLGVGGLGVVAEKAKEVDAALSQASGIVGKVQALVLTYWPVLAVAAAGFLIWQAAKRIKEARVEDAQTGRHLGK